MMEISDELFTPGCPQCAVKHLSAALAYLLRPGRTGTWCRSKKYAAIAKINLAEVLVGYKSHLWYAVGMLQHSEEAALAEGSSYAVVRHARLLLEEKGLAAAGDALRELDLGMVFEPEEMCDAHLHEAAREMPSCLNYPINPDPEILVREIERIQGEYFAGPTVGPEQGETTTETGDRKMATAKKAPAKKATCKGTKCACKGGKTKKGK